MTTRNTLQNSRNSAPRALKLTVLCAALLGMAGCSTLTDMMSPDHIDYKSAGKVVTKSLEVPPDLTQLQKDSRYAIPDTAAGSVTASAFGQKGPASVAAAPVLVDGSSVAPKSSASLRVERSGNQRYIVVKQAPEALWPQIKEFWQDAGFLISLDQPQVGIMETDWAENRGKIPQDLLRRTLGKVLDSLYSTSERDKFRTRLERAVDGSTEIYISHRGVQEVLTGREKDGAVWTARPSEPELEAEFIARLMTRLGTDPVAAKTMASAAAPTATGASSHAKLMKASDGSYVEVDEEFDRAWRRVGLALDRVNFTVEDRDRTLGLYFVRYVDDASMTATGERSWWSRLFTYDGGDKTKAAKYRVSVKGAATSSKVSLVNEDGKPDTSPAADKILILLSEQLK